MSKVYIVAAKRTAIGSFMGSLSKVKPAALGGTVIKNIIEETKIDPKNIDEVILGNVLSAGQGQGAQDGCRQRPHLAVVAPGW
jgi:acetyl-CoA C-acetyltransferase